MKIIAFCGPHNAGKTTLIKEVIQRLKEEGFSISVVKSTKHKISFGEPGKDTTVFLNSPTKAVALMSKENSIFVYKENLRIEKLPLFLNSDFVLLEGFKHSPFPKVAVFREYESSFWEGIENIVAVVTEKPSSKLPWEVPNFSFKDLDDLTYFIQENAMAIPDTLLYVNGENIQLKPFLQGILKEVVTGFVKNLKGIEEPLREINIKIKF